MSVTLAAIAISISTHRTPKHSPNPINITLHHHHHLSFNASRSLRQHGFNATATLLQVYPEVFLSSPQSITIFAIPDSALSDLSAHPNSLKQLLKYHTSPSYLPLQELLKKPQGTCLPTLVLQRRIAITKTTENGSIEINNVLVSHPDVFLEGPISIHGVLGPFSSSDSEIITQPQICDPNYNRVVSNLGEIKDLVEWAPTVRSMSSKGFVSFAIGLHSVLDGILRDYPDLNSVTIFAPIEFSFVGSSWSLLERIVRFHLVPQRLTFMDLASLPEKANFRTLVPDRNLLITTTTSAHSKGLLGINGVEVIAPDCFLSKNFAIHGISRAFSIEELPSSSREIGFL